jgi:tRNA 2-thiouridine synthesizing protein E
MTKKTNEQGFLIDHTQWTEQWATQIALDHQLELTQVDFDIINALRNFYIEFDLSPPMRPLVKIVKTKVNPEYGTSIWLMQRYGESPARVLALLAGLPKPKNCL